MIVAIHQPNLFPWLGYFREIAIADILVILDTVQFTRGNWINRVQILVNGVPKWITCPVKRPCYGVNITEVLINDQEPWRLKLLRTLEVSYRRARFYDRVMPWLGQIIQERLSLLSEYNSTAIEAVTAALGLTCICAAITACQP